MTIPEMIYVLDKEKDCVQKREYGNCDKDCAHCDCHMDATSLLDAFERIINLIFNIDKHSTRKGY